MTIQTLDIDGRKLVVLTEEAFAELMEKAGVLPPLPPADKNGTRDALAFADAAIARKLVTRRIRAGLTQTELARRSGVRLETICRLEGGKHR
jgi:DNA-binding XRE family transcriptional regulator